MSPTTPTTSYCRPARSSDLSEWVRVRPDQAGETLTHDAPPAVDPVVIQFVERTAGQRAGRRARGSSRRSRCVLPHPHCWPAAVWPRFARPEPRADAWRKRRAGGHGNGCSCPEAWIVVEEPFVKLPRPLGIRIPARATTCVRSEHSLVRTRAERVAGGRNPGAAAPRRSGALSRAPSEPTMRIWRSPTREESVVARPACISDSRQIETRCAERRHDAEDESTRNRDEQAKREDVRHRCASHRDVATWAEAWRARAGVRSPQRVPLPCR